MLAPWCEPENSGALIAELGEESLAWWQAHFEGTVRNGTLSSPMPATVPSCNSSRGAPDALRRSMRAALTALEPELAGRFSEALYFPEEGHLDPRRALSALVARLERARGPDPPWHRGTHDASGRARWWSTAPGLPRARSCRSCAASRVRCCSCACRRLRLARPVRVLHPRIPVYVVPRAAGVFMIGATLIESDEPTRISARSMLELLTRRLRLAPGVRRGGDTGDRHRRAAGLSR